jgi:predicted GNAT family acetyltransferase
MEVKNRNDGKRGVFYLDDNGTEAGLMHYTLAGPGKMIIDHTEVSDGYEGHGLGKQLVKAGVEYARKNHLKILPLCPFAKKIFDLTPAFADVLF